MMKEAALGRKARRYANGVAKILCGSRKTIPADAVEDLLTSAYYNGHQSGEVHAQVDGCRRNMMVRCKAKKRFISMVGDPDVFVRCRRKSKHPGKHRLSKKDLAARGSQI